MTAITSLMATPFRKHFASRDARDESYSLRLGWGYALEPPGSNRREAPRSHHQLRPVPGKMACCSFSQPAARPGDYDHLSLEVLCQSVCFTEVVGLRDGRAEDASSRRSA